MFRLYGFMLTQLQNANINKNKAPIKTVYVMLSDIRDSWEQMLKKTAKQNAEDAAAQSTSTSSDEVDSREPKSKIGGGLDASA